MKDCVVRTLRNLIFFLLSIGFSGASLAAVWTGEIVNVRVWESDKAEIFLENIRDHKSCGQHLGV